MRLPVYYICAALIVAIKSEDNGELFGNILEPMHVEQEPVNYYFPKFAAKFKPDWNRISDTRFYLFPDANDLRQDEALNVRSLHKRQYESFIADGNVHPSLSIKAPIDVLRKAMYQKNMQRMIDQNRIFLNSF